MKLALTLVLVVLNQLVWANFFLDCKDGEYILYSSSLENGGVCLPKKDWDKSILTGETLIESFEGGGDDERGDTGSEHEMAAVAHPDYDYCLKENPCYVRVARREVLVDDKGQSILNDDGSEQVFYADHNYEYNNLIKDPQKANLLFEQVAQKKKSKSSEEDLEKALNEIGLTADQLEENIKIGRQKGRDNKSARISKSCMSDITDAIMSGQNTEASFCLFCQKSKEIFEGLKNLNAGVVSPECVKASMTSNITKKLNRATCQKGKLKLMEPGSCGDDNVAQKVSQLINGLAKCQAPNLQESQQLSPSHMYALMNHESSLMPNAISGTNAICFGQLTQVAVEQVNISFNPKSFSESCEEPLKSNIKEIDKTDKCSLVNSPETCLAYSYLFQSYLKKQTLKTLAGYGNAFKNQDEIANLATMWSHNGGLSVSTTHLKGFLDRYKPKKMTTDKFISEFSNYLGQRYSEPRLERISDSTKKANAIAHRRKEVKTFLPKVIADVKRVSASANQTCGPSARIFE